MTPPYFLPIAERGQAAATGPMIRLIMDFLSRGDDGITDKGKAWHFCNWANHDEVFPKSKTFFPDACISAHLRCPMHDPKWAFVFSIVDVIDSISCRFADG